MVKTEDLPHNLDWGEKKEDQPVAGLKHFRRWRKGYDPYVGTRGNVRMNVRIFYISVRAFANSKHLTKACERDKNFQKAISEAQHSSFMAMTEAVNAPHQNYEPFRPVLLVICMT